MRAAFPALVFLAVVSSAQAPKTGSPKPGIRVLVDGEEIAFRDGKPQSVAGRTLVPMRAIFEALGASVQWSKEFRKITARKDGLVVELTIDERIARKNGAEITMDAAPVIRAKSTLVPLRFVAEALEARVDYEKATGIIRIATGGGVAPPAADPGGGGESGGSTGGR